MYIPYNWFKTRKDAIDKLESVRGSAVADSPLSYLCTKVINILERCILKSEIIDYLNKAKESGNKIDIDILIQDIEKM